MDKLEEAIKNIILDDGKIQCKDALQVAKDLNINPSQVGKEIDRLKIKIKDCQLGCFG